MRIFSHTCCGLLLLAAGCGSPTPSADTTPVSQAPAKDVHEHASVGPHHGTLVELGDESFHAEVVHDASTVTIYILDGTAKNAAAIDASEVTINLLHDGQPEQFKLASSPAESDPPGTSSQFTLADPELVGHLGSAAAAPRLTFTAAGTPYQGKISHVDHTAHDHAH